jgi:hypothetical protein
VPETAYKTNIFGIFLKIEIECKIKEASKLKKSKI